MDNNEELLLFNKQFQKLKKNKNIVIIRVELLYYYLANSATHYMYCFPIQLFII